MSRLLLTISLLVAAVVAFTHLDGAAPRAEALAPGDVLGVYQIRLRGTGFVGNSALDASKSARVRGRARLTLSRQEDESNTRGLKVTIELHPTLEGTLIDRATPKTAFEGNGTLVGDSLMAIATGSPNVVNAVTMRFTRNGRVVSGWWLTSADGAAIQSNFVTGVGSTFRGRRLAIKPAPLPEPRPVRVEDVVDSLR